jgi:hypothetical protein
MITTSRITRIARRTAAPIVAITLTGAAFLALTGVASAATPAVAIPSTAVDKGVYSLQETITNNTDVAWTYNAQNSSEADADHWQQRPQQVLAAHTSEVVSNYTDDPILGEDVQVAYTMPNGDYIRSTYDMNYQEDGEFDSGWTGVYTANPDGGTAPTDSNFTVTSNAGEGSHVDAAFTVAEV